MEIQPFDDWKSTKETEFQQTTECLSLENWLLTRNSTTNNETCVWLKIHSTVPFLQPILNNITIKSNARFVEVYYLENKNLEYISTVRGVTESNRFVFEAKLDKQIKFSQLHFKFLSIKPHSVEPVDKNSLELKITSLEINLQPNGQFNPQVQSPLATLSATSASGQSSVNDGNNIINSSSSINTANAPPPPQRTGPPDIKEMLLAEINKSNAAESVSAQQQFMMQQQAQKQQSSPPPPPPQSGGMQMDSTTMQLMYQMKQSMLADFSAILDVKLAPLIKKIDKLETSVNRIATVMSSVGIDV